MRDIIFEEYLRNLLLNVTTKIQNDTYAFLILRCIFMYKYYILFFVLKNMYLTMFIEIKLCTKLKISQEIFRKISLWAFINK